MEWVAIKKNRVYPETNNNLVVLLENKKTRERIDLNNVIYDKDTKKWRYKNTLEEIKGYKVIAWLYNK